MLDSMRSELIEIWNVQDCVQVYAAAQRVFYLLGRLNNSEIVESLVYSLNGGSVLKVSFRNGNASASH